MQEDEEADYLGDEDDCESADGGSEEEEIMEVL